MLNTHNLIPLILSVAVSTHALAANVNLLVENVGNGTITSEPTGINCPANCTAPFITDATVKITAVPNTGHKFTNWSGHCTGSSNPTYVIMNQEKSCAANFEALPTQHYDITLVKTAYGNITSVPEGINCGETCSKTFDGGTPVTLIAQPLADASFIGWGGDCPQSTALTIVATINASMTCTANFKRNPIQLSVLKSGNGNGILASNPTGINCGNDCTTTFDADTLITLTATADASSKFIQWSGDCVANQDTPNQTQVSLTESKSCTAEFEPLPHTLTVTKTGGEGTIISSPGEINCGAQCSDSFEDGTELSLTATPAEDYKLLGWLGDCTGTDKSATVTMNADKLCTAKFGHLEKILTVEAENGTVTSDLAGINCGTECITSYEYQTQILLTATPELGYQFVGWHGDCVGFNPSTTLTMDTAKTCTAHFAQQPAAGLSNLTAVTIGGNGLIESEPEGINCNSLCTLPYDTDLTLRLTATPQSDSTFIGWNQDCSGTEESTLITLNNTFVTCVAEFELLPPDYVLTITKAGDGDGTINSDLAGIDCGSQCKAPYTQNATVTVTATPNETSAFVGWSNQCSGTEPTATVTLDAAKTCTANFNKLPTYTLTITDSGNGNGTVTVPYTPEDIQCQYEKPEPESCPTEHAINAQITITAEPNSGSKFMGWENDCTGTSDSTTLTLDRDKNCTAKFEQLPTYALTVTTTGAGDNQVERNPIGTSCGENCQQYLQAETVELTAVPSTDYKFTGWTGDCNGSQNPLTVTMNEEKTCTANFDERINFALTLKLAGDGTGTINSNNGDNNFDCQADCISTYYEGTTITLTATPETGATFTGWTGDCTSTEPETTVTVAQATTCTATFINQPPATLTITKEGTGSGTVTAPIGLGDGLNCGQTCSETYSTNSNITLTAVANNDSIFTAWTGNCSGNQPINTIALTNDKICTAIFSPKPPPGNYVLTLTQPENGQISSDPAGLNCGTECSAHYPEGSTVNLTATAAAGYVFTNWSGDCHSVSAKTIVTLNTHQSCAAHFLEPPPAGQYHLTLLKIGSGTITSDTGAIDCGDQCTAAYPQGTTVTLTAKADTFSRFTGWEGDCTATNQSQATVTVNQKANCTATFETLPSRVQFLLPNYQINEILGKARLTVTRAGSPDGAISIDYTTTDGTAQAGDDYTTATGTIAWNNGDMQPQSFEVFINADDLEEEDETLTVILSNPTGGATVGTNAQATVTITDTPLTGAGLLQFSATDYAVIEGENPIATLSVERLGGTTGQVSIDYQTHDSTADAGSDYTHRQGTLKWAGGEGQTKTLTVPIIADDVPEAEETLTVELFNPSTNVELGPNQTATLKIIDSLGTPSTASSPGILQFSQTNYSVDEDSDDVTLTVSRTHGTEGAVTVGYATQAGTAKADSDYVTTTGLLNWTDGEANNKNITVPIQSDNDAENDETFTVQLTNPSGNASLGALPLAQVKILDSFGTPTTPEPPSPGTIQFVANNYQIAENDGNITITVSRTDGEQGVVEVTYTTDIADDDTANHQDYIATQGTFRWLAGDTESKSFKVSLYDDGLIEGHETITLKLEQPTGGAKLGTNQQVKLTILDNDSTTIQLASNTYLVDEDEGEVTLTVTREGGRFGSVAVDYEIAADCQSTLNNCATADEDYQMSNQQTLTWVSGEGSHKTITIPIRDDRLVEGNELLRVQLVNLTGNAQFGEPIEATITIVDNDTGECHPALLIDCSLNNQGEQLQDIKIGPYGAIIGGQLGGLIQNEGVIQDVTLLANTQITGGFEMGKVRGQISGNPNSPALLNYVEIAADTTLADVIIGSSAIVNSGVTLKQGVRFESNGTVPYLADLNQILGQMNSPGLQIEAVKLTNDVLVNQRQDGILGAMNGLYELVASRLLLKQNPENGMLMAALPPFYYTALPTQVRQVWGQQTIANQPLQPMGLTVIPTGELIFVTHTGREVTAVPVVQDALALREALSIFGLNEMIMQPNGNLKVPAGNGSYYMARPNLFSETIDSWVPLGLNGTNSQWLDNIADLFLVFTAADSTPSNGNSNPFDLNGDSAVQTVRQQLMYPAAACPEVLYGLAATSNSKTTLHNDGRILAYIGRGVNNKAYKGLFDYLVTSKQPTGGLQVHQIDDVNGDGFSDYRITCPNGDSQVVYQCPSCFE